jgi:hypothetical protein
MHNASELPVTEAGVRFRTLTRREARRRYSGRELSAFEKEPDDINGFLSGSTLEVEGGDETGVVMPGETATRALLGNLEDPATGPYVRAWISFRDAGGTEWLRDLETGRLMKAGRRSTRVRLVGGSRQLLRRYRGPLRPAYRHWLRQG